MLPPADPIATTECGAASPASGVAAGERRPELSIVVVSWNTRELLASCLGSIFALAEPSGGTYRLSPGGPNFEVLVVDNASADGSAGLVRDRFPMVQLIANQENVGFARANNQAMPLCRGRYVLLLNPDTAVAPGALETLVRFMASHPEAGAAGARLLAADGTLQRSCYPAPTLARELWRLFHLDLIWPYGTYRMGRWDTSRPRPVDVVQGACLIVRREVLDRVGLLDPEYFIYSEEVDLCQRIRLAGWRIYWVPAAVVVHHEGQSTRQAAAAMFLRLYQGKVLYFRKNHGRHAARAYKLVLLCAALVRVLLTPLAWAIGSPEQRAVARHYRRLLVSLPAL